MRLINTRTLELEDFIGESVPRYAILSHTWGLDEASFFDWHERRDSLSTLRDGGFAKIRMARGQALSDGIEYLWVDTVCIDRSSLAEASEAINAMFKWYRNAYVCYAHLSDVGAGSEDDEEDADDDTTTVQEEGEDDDDDDDAADMMRKFSTSRWFRRGWTLQELLAPARVVFYSKFWTKLGTKHDMAGHVATITGIEETYLLGADLAGASIAKRMSWMSQRRTTRPEDMAYSMMGIFDINMPLLYGEGNKAFMRLQAEIMKQSVDETLFCWSWNDETPHDWVNLLAPSPSNFANSAKYEESPGLHSSYTLTNLGINISLRLTTLWTHYFAVLNVQSPDSSPVGIALAGYPEKGIFWRTNFPPGPIELPLKGSESTAIGSGNTNNNNSSKDLKDSISGSGSGSNATTFRKNVFVLSRMPKSVTGLARPLSWEAPPFKYAVMIAFSDRSTIQMEETVPPGMFDARTSLLALQQSTRRRGIHGAIIRLRVHSRFEMRFLFAINASGRPCWYFVDLTPSSSSTTSSSSSTTSSSYLTSSTSPTRMLLEMTGQEDLERHLDTLSVQHAVRGTRYVQKADHAVSIGRALRMPNGGVLRLVHVRTGRCF